MANRHLADSAIEDGKLKMPSTTEAPGKQMARQTRDRVAGVVTVFGGKYSNNSRKNNFNQFALKFDMKN